MERIMNIETTHDGGILVATLNGRMDAVTAPEFDAWFSTHLQAGENRLILDMSGLDYISSAGLRSLLAAAKKIKASGGAVVLCGLSGTVAEVFTMSGFMAIFTVVATRSEAVNAMG
jgi:anti-sigma B factor antagonist